MTNNQSFIPEEVVQPIKNFFSRKWVALMILLISILLLGFLSIPYLGQDNPIEEIAEKVIKDGIDVDIDLTPNTKE